MSPQWCDKASHKWLDVPFGFHSWDVKGQREEVSAVFAWLTKTQWFYPVTLVNLDRIGYRELALTLQKPPTNPQYFSVIQLC